MIRKLLLFIRKIFCKHKWKKFEYGYALFYRCIKCRKYYLGYKEDQERKIE